MTTGVAGVASTAVRNFDGNRLTRNLTDAHFRAAEANGPNAVTSMFAHNAMLNLSDYSWTNSIAAGAGAGAIYGGVTGGLSYDGSIIGGAFSGAMTGGMLGGVGKFAVNSYTTGAKVAGTGGAAGTGFKTSYFTDGIFGK